VRLPGCCANTGRKQLIAPDDSFSKGQLCIRLSPRPIATRIPYVLVRAIGCVHSPHMPEAKNRPSVPFWRTTSRDSFPLGKRRDSQLLALWTPVQHVLAVQKYADPSVRSIPPLALAPIGNSDPGRTLQGWSIACSGRQIAPLQANARKLSLPADTVPVGTASISVGRLG
jgi:hypothetical protein